MVGEGARSQVLASVELYRRLFARYAELDWDAVAALGLEFREPIQAYDAEILTEIEGIAEGAGLQLGEVLAINARSEILFGLGDLSLPECTAFYAGPSVTEDKRVLLGQNWDWFSASDSATVIEVDQGPERPAFVMAPEAGLIGKMGFNEDGIGVTLNALFSDLDRGERDVPVHVILRAILNSRTIEQALAAIVRARRGSSANYTIASACGPGLAVEVGPGGVETVNLVKPVDGVLGHANHFTEEVEFEDLCARDYPGSKSRLAMIEALLGARRGTITADVAKEVLRNREGAVECICPLPDETLPELERYSTVLSIVMDLTSRTAEVAAGPPSEADYVSVVPRFARGDQPS
jgi:isopenicillin-N N-acyltransferase-like protein